MLCHHLKVFKDKIEEFVDDYDGKKDVAEEKVADEDLADEDDEVDEDEENQEELDEADLELTNQKVIPTSSIFWTLCLIKLKFCNWCWVIKNIVCITL